MTIETLTLTNIELTVDRESKTVTMPLTPEIEAALPKGGRWRAKKGGRYWVVTDYGDISTVCEAVDKFDSCHWAIGNYHQTQQQALAWRDRHLLDLIESVE